MNEPAPTAEPTDLSTSGSELPPNNLFVGPHGLRPFWGLLLYLAILATPVMLFVVASHLAGQKAMPDGHELSPLSGAVGEWCQFAFVFFATWIMSRIESRSVFDYGLARTPRRLQWLLIGAALGLTFQSLLVVTLWSTHHLVVAGVLLRPLPAVGYGLAWAIAFLGVGFFEESLFRGYLQFNLTQCMADLVRYFSPASRHAEAIGFWGAAVLISFGFGLLHGFNPGESPIGILCAGGAGLMFAFSLWRTGSLWWAIGLHAAWDWAQSFLFGVADSGSVSMHRLLSTHPVGSAWVSGGATGPEGSIFVLPVMLVIVLIAALTLPRTRTSFLTHPAPEGTHLTPEVNSAEG
jgi:membrane protease YdiL (CAAX protease family)